MFNEPASTRETELRFIFIPFSANFNFSQTTGILLFIQLQETVFTSSWVHHLHTYLGLGLETGKHGSGQKFQKNLAGHRLQLLVVLLLMAFSAVHFDSSFQTVACRNFDNMVLPCFVRSAPHCSNWGLFTYRCCFKRAQEKELPMFSEWSKLGSHLFCVDKKWPSCM
jgi:hypothetical protein